jgi:transcriptional regulator with XRE-family HTH domain
MTQKESNEKRDGVDAYLHPDYVRLQQAARSLLGWSQKDLAKLTGVSLSTLNRLERGEGSPSINTLRIISTVFKMAGVDVRRYPDGSIGVKISAEGLANSHEYPIQPDGSKLIKIWLDDEGL